MTQEQALTSLFASVEKIAPFSCHLLKDDNSLKDIPSAPEAVGISFIEDNISEFILKLRISEDLPNEIRKAPVIFFGFRSFRSLLKTERFPKLLSSPGIYYLRLPMSIQKLQSVLTSARQCKLENPVEAVAPCIHSPDEMSREQSKLAHILGNFFGCEKLLYGAYLAKNIASRKLKYTVEEIRRIQFQHCQEENIFDYRLFLATQPDLINKPDLKECRSDPIPARILLIDDLGNLGWAQAIARALCSEEELAQTTPTGKDNGVIVDKFACQGNGFLLESISRDFSEKKVTENIFFDNLLQKIRGDYIDTFDIILLDLRLKKSADENLVDPTKASGTEVLCKLRKINKGIPIVVLTASRMAKNMDKVYHLGADDYFIKEMRITSDEEAEDYYRRFRESIRYALSKAYLVPAWKAVEYIESNYSADPKEDKKEEVRLFKRSLIFLKKKSYKFERDEMGYDTISYAVIELDKIKEKKMKTNTISNSLDGGMLLQSLRNIGAHAENIRLVEFDAKVAFYLALRLFPVDDSILMEFVGRAFDGGPAISVEDVILLSYSKLASLLGLSYSKAIKVPLGEFLSQEEKRKKLLEPNYFTKYCEGGSPYRRIEYIYLFFLCRIPLQRGKKYSMYGKYLKADIAVLSEIGNRLKGLRGTSTDLSGTIDPKNRVGFGYEVSSMEIQGKITCPIQLGDKALNYRLKQGIESPIKFDLARTGDNEYFAVNVKLIGTDDST